VADSAGGHNAVIKLQAGGGLFAQRMVMRKPYDFAASERRTLQVAGLADAGNSASN
jgi:4-hydroxybutyryl-CoA dehydratase/vinylacetyl-CoA-Delta-isomerase